jgi:hypothetical protein
MKIMMTWGIAVLLMILAAAMAFVVAQAQNPVDLHAIFPYEAGPFINTNWSCAVVDQEHMLCDQPNVGTAYLVHIIDNVHLPTAVVQCTILDLRLETPESWRVYARCNAEYLTFFPYLSR